MARTSSKASSTSSKIVKSIPSSETGTGVVCYTKPNMSGDKYIISQNPLKEQFTLWKCIDDEYEKIATANNPSKFDEMIPYEKQF